MFEEKNESLEKNECVKKNERNDSSTSDIVMPIFISSKLGA